MNTIQFLERLDILYREELLNRFNSRAESFATRPELTLVRVNDIETKVVKWFRQPRLDEAKDALPEQLFFPVIPPAIPEWEMTSVDEWDVYFVGTVKELRVSVLANLFHIPPDLSEERTVVVLKVNHYLTDLQNQDMSDCFYCGELALRPIKGWINRPRSFSFYDQE